MRGGDVFALGESPIAIGGASGTMLVNRGEEEDLRVPVAVDFGDVCDEGVFV